MRGGRLVAGRLSLWAVDLHGVGSGCAESFRLWRLARRHVPAAHARKYQRLPPRRIGRCGPYMPHGLITERAERGHFAQPVIGGMVRRNYAVRGLAPDPFMEFRR